jgi:mRNA interferase MazF
MIRGRIVLVPFPFDDLAATRVRPAVCLTEPIGPHRHIVLAFISSQVPADLLPSDLVLDAGHADHAGTGLRTSSVLRLHRMMTVATSLILRELGGLSAGWQAEVDARLRELFAL